jgi:bla regulator protein blaR1
MIAAWINHLWQSTVFAFAAGLLTLAFRGNRASVRFSLWCCASYKFLVPLALLLNLGSHLRWGPVAPKTGTPATSIVILQLTEPIPPTVEAAVAVRRRRDWIPAAIATVWACGFLSMVVIRFRGWRRIRASVRASVPINLGLPVAVRSSPALMEPGVVGLWRPILLLPAGIIERLTPAQLEAVLAHELAHIRRRDNLTASIHMLVEAIFWFHPLVWWIGARMMEERERASDEAVLSRGSEPKNYAEGILGVCRSYVESPLRCVSGVTGADLKKRIEVIMSNHVVRTLNPAKRLGLVIAGLMALGVPLAIGILNAPAIRAQSASIPRFEVASIKPCRDGPPGRGGGPIGHGTLNVECVTVIDLMRSAYVTWANGRLNAPKSLRIEGGPSWIYSERYTIRAKSESDAGMMMLSGPMLQALIEDRFHLKAHHEIREIPVYELTVAKNGPRLHPVPEGSCTPIDFDNLPKISEPGTVAYCDTVGKRRGGPNITLDFHAMTMAQFVNELPVDRPVIDKTGLTGLFESTLEFAPSADEATSAYFRQANPATAVPEDPGGPSIFSALQQQLGLKLESANGPGTFLVIDSVERPTGN